MRLHRTVAAEGRPRRRVASLAGAGLGFVIFTGGVSGCSLLYNLDTAQCSTNADCDALGGVFVGLACEKHLCVTPAGCETNVECIDTVGSGTEPYICRARQCIGLLTPECPTLLPQLGDGWGENLRNDKVLILAGTGVIRGSAPYDDRLKNYDLALTEFTQRATGLQGGTRPLVMLGCQATYDSTDQLDAMMNHLVDVVKVPGLVATMEAANLQRAFVQKGKDANLFFMSPLASDPTLATLETNGLVWYVGPGAEFIARPYAPLLTRVLTHLAVTGTVRVATVVSSGDRFATNTLAAIQDDPDRFGIAYNGGNSVFDNGSNYLGVSIANGDQSLVSQIQQLLDFKPHVIFSVANDPFFTDIVPQVEAGWAAAAPGQAPPFYILSALNYNSPALDALIGRDSTLASRMVGVNGQSAIDDGALGAYTVAWNAAFHQNVRATGYENYYDAAYYLIYSAVGAGQFLTNDGNDFKRGMARLLSGPDHYVGYIDMPAAIQALAPANATITLNGTLGPPDFNPQDGTRQSPGSVWCIDAAGVYHSDVLRYMPGTDAASASLTGTFPAGCTAL